MIKTKVLPISKARVHLGKVVERVRERGEHVVIEKNGIPIVVIMDIDDYEDWLDVHDPKIQQRIERSYREFKSGKFIPAERVMAEVERKYPVKKG